MKKVLLAAVVALTAMGANAQIARSTMFEAPEHENNTMWYFRAGVSINNAAVNGDMKDALEAEYGDTGLGSKAGYDFQFGFNKTIGGTDAYWGMEFGFGTRGYSQNIEVNESQNAYGYTVNGYYQQKESLLSHTFKITPVMFGYKYGISDKIKIDAHLGAFISVDMAGTYKIENEYSITNNFDASLNQSGSSKEDFGIGDINKDNFDYDYNRFDAGIQAGIGVWYGRWNLDFTYQRGFCSIYSFDDYDNFSPKVSSSNAVIRLGFAF